MPEENKKLNSFPLQLHLVFNLLINVNFPVWSFDVFQWNYCACIFFFEKSLPQQEIVAAHLVVRTQVYTLQQRWGKLKTYKRSMAA